MEDDRPPAEDVAEGDEDHAPEQEESRVRDPGAEARPEPDPEEPRMAESGILRNDQGYGGQAGS